MPATGISSFFEERERGIPVEGVASVSIRCSSGGTVAVSAGGGSGFVDPVSAGASGVGGSVVTYCESSILGEVPGVVAWGGASVGLAGVNLPFIIQRNPMMSATPITRAMINLTRVRRTIVSAPCS
jgi:hypothetical protein